MVKLATALHIKASKGNGLLTRLRLTVERDLTQRGAKQCLPHTQLIVRISGRNLLNPVSMSSEAS